MWNGNGMEKQFKLRERRNQLRHELLQKESVECYKIVNPSNGTVTYYLPTDRGSAVQDANRLSLYKARKEEKEFYEHALSDVAKLRVPVEILVKDPYTKAKNTEERREVFFELAYIKDAQAKKFFNLKYKECGRRSQNPLRGPAEILQEPRTKNLAFWYLNKGEEGYRGGINGAMGSYLLHGNTVQDVARAFNTMCYVSGFSAITQSNEIMVPDDSMNPTMHRIFQMEKMDPKCMYPVGTEMTWRGIHIGVVYKIKETFIPLLKTWLSNYAKDVTTTSDDWYKLFKGYTEKVGK